MAFTLRVTLGAGEAEEFSFDGGEARLGRTADNDVVIKDPSSSRSHARVYEEDGRFFVEDLKSANGTKLNGRAVKAPLPLKSGDRIVIGDVTLVFTTTETNDTVLGASSTMDESGGDAEAEDPNATMLKEPAPLVRASQPIRRPPTQSRKAAAPPPEPEEPEEPQDEAPPDDEPPAEEDPEASGNSTRNFEVPPPKAIQKRGGSAPPVRTARGAAAKGEDVPVLSAAERARQRRELSKSTSGRAMLLWGDLPLFGKIAVGVVGVGLVGAMLVGLVMVAMPKKVAKKVEEVELTPNGDPVADVYGLGDEVDIEKTDQKSFTFSYAAPTSIVGVLHYQARDCSKDEVTIELNGAPVGSVPPDTVETRTRQLELVLPATQLKVNEPNEIVFDNINNPPADDPWAIWNVWIEVIPIPQMSPDDAARRAKEDLERAAKMYEMRQVGAMNLFRSWKQYRDAWLLLEAQPDRPPELLQLARTRMREIRPELDQKCSAMLVDYQKIINQKYPDYTAARKVLQNIPAHFEKEHPCFGMSRGLLRSLEDLSGMPEE